MYQNQSQLSTNDNIDVDDIDLLRHNDAQSLTAENSIGTPSVAVDPSNAKSSLAKSSDASDLSSAQLILLIIAIIVLATALAWYFENIGERLERLQRRIRHWRDRLLGDRFKIRMVEFPINKVQLPPPGTDWRSDNPEDDVDMAASQERAEVLEPERAEEVEPEQGDQRKEPNDAFVENRNLGNSHTALHTASYSDPNDRIRSVCARISKQ